jgi:hypothetical protein
MGGVNATPIDEWVKAFKNRVAQITEGPSCPQ